LPFAFARAPSIYRRAAPAIGVQLSVFADSRWPMADSLSPAPDDQEKNDGPREKDGKHQPPTWSSAYFVAQVAGGYFLSR